MDCEILKKIPFSLIVTLSGSSWCRSNKTSRHITQLSQMKFISNQESFGFSGLQKAWNKKLSSACEEFKNSGLVWRTFCLSLQTHQIPFWILANFASGLEIRKNRLIGDFFVRMQIINRSPPPTPPSILEISIKVQFSVVTLLSTLFKYSIQVVERQLTTWTVQLELRT